MRQQFGRGVFLRVSRRKWLHTDEPFIPPGAVPPLDSLAQMDGTPSTIKGLVFGAPAPGSVSSKGAWKLRGGCASNQAHFSFPCELLE